MKKNVVEVFGAKLVELALTERNIRASGAKLDGSGHTGKSTAI